MIFVLLGTQWWESTSDYCLVNGITLTMPGLNMISIDVITRDFSDYRKKRGGLGM